MQPDVELRKTQRNPNCEIRLPSFPAIAVGRFGAVSVSDSKQLASVARKNTRRICTYLAFGDVTPPSNPASGKTGESARMCHSTCRKDKPSVSARLD